MVHCLITDKENYCAFRPPQSYELHTVEGVFYPLLYKFFIEAYCALRSPSCEGPYDGRRFLFAVYATFAPHRMRVRTTDGDI